MTKKIQDTKLFSDAQKVDLLVKLQDASDEDKMKLEAGIDIFDAEYVKTVAKHSAQIRSILGHAAKDMSEEERNENQVAIDEIKLGLAFLN